MDVGGKVWFSVNQLVGLPRQQDLLNQQIYHLDFFNAAKDTGKEQSEKDVHVQAWLCAIQDSMICIVS